MNWLTSNRHVQCRGCIVVLVRGDWMELATLSIMMVPTMYPKEDSVEEKAAQQEHGDSPFNTC